MPDYRRGVAAIKEAAESKGGGRFSPFAPSIKWTDGEKKYVLILTPVSEVGTFDLHEWIPTGKGEKADGETYTKYDDFLSRKDPFIGEDHDRIYDDLGRPPKTRCMGIAVELEPIVEDRDGRLRPVSFEVKTTTYTRKGDDGEEEITQPVIGEIIQSSALMWKPLMALDESIGPLSEIAIQITRDGGDQNTRYNFVHMQGLPIDLSNVVEYLDGISYLKDDVEDVIHAVEAADGEVEQAQAVAEALFDVRLKELADGERYDRLVGPITELPDKFGKKSKKAAPAKRAPRPSRREESANGAEPEADAEPVEPAPAKDDKFAALKARVEGSK